MSIIGFYEKHPDIFILGKQFADNFCSSVEVKALEKAYTSDDTRFNGLYKLAFHHCFDMLIDLYNLGRIHGIRQERERRKKKEPGQR
jgi:hypothetical protein